MVTLTDVQLDIVKRFKELRKNYMENVRKIKNVAKRIFDNRFVAVYVFGSVISGKTHPMSDVDVAIILSEEVCEEERIKLYKEVRKMFGLHPFEIHILTVNEWEKWYRKFVKDNFIKI